MAQSPEYPDLRWMPPADTWALEQRDSGTNGLQNATRTHLETSLTSGSNTFTIKYRVSGGTGTVQRRHLTVIPF